MESPLRIDHLTRPEYEDLITGRPIILPVGATEQHGLHLPLGTDALCATDIAERVSARTGALVAPTLSYGYRSIPRSGGGEEFAGTTSMTLATMVAILKEVIGQIIEDGATRICVLSGHYENRIAIHEAAHELTASTRNAKLLAFLWADFLSHETLDEIFPDQLVYPGVELEHAAFLETSVMLYLHPELVRDVRSPDEKVAEFPPYDVYPTPEGLVPASGSLAPTTGATAPAGRKVIDECVAGITEAITKELGPVPSDATH